MAKLPTYDSKRAMSTQAPGIQQSLDVAAQTGKSVATMGKAAAAISDAWQKAEDFKQKLENKNRMDIGANDIHQRAVADPDHTNKQSYRDELDKLKEGIGGFTNNLARMEFEEYANSTIIQSGIKLDGLYNKKNLDWTNANIATQNQVNHGKYIAGGVDAKAIQKAIIEKAYADGITTKVQTVKDLDALKDWEYDRAIYDANNGKFTNVNDYDVRVGKRDDLLREVKQIKEMQNVMDEVAVTEMKYNNQQDFLKDVQGGMSPEEALDRLEYGIENKTMNEDWAESRRRVILSSLGVDAGTQKEYYSKVAQKINRASAPYAEDGGGKNARQYIKEANEALVMINEGRARGELSLKDEGVLTGRVYTKDWGKAEYEAARDLREATEYYKNTLTKEELPFAVIEYIESGKKKFDKTEDKIADQVKAMMRTVTLNEKQSIENREFLQSGDVKDIGGVPKERVEGGWMELPKDDLRSIKFYEQKKETEEMRKRFPVKLSEEDVG